MYHRLINQFRKDFEERIFFLHLPKCGGVSIDRAIKACYRNLDIRRDMTLMYVDPSASRRAAILLKELSKSEETDDLAMVLGLRDKLLVYYMSMDRARYVTGHFAFNEAIHHAHKEAFSYVTMIREPVSRFVSSYIYNRYKKSDHLKIHKDLAEYVESEEGKMEGATYVRFLCGVNGRMSPNTPEAIESAKDNLDKFEIVGILEKTSVFVSDFKEKFGARLRLRKRNESPKSKAFIQSMMTEEIEVKIKEICKPDIAIYEYATTKCRRN